MWPAGLVYSPRWVSAERSVPLTVRCRLSDAAAARSVLLLREPRLHEESFLFAVTNRGTSGTRQPFLWI